MACPYLIFSCDNDFIVNTEKPEPVYLHLECDKFKPDLMYSEPTKGNHVLWRMCPPGKSHFFFTVEGRPQLSTSYCSVPCKLSAVVLIPIVR
ncbi:MAG: hypothetical protein P4M11_02895 [Candidatus Pacebacteria bacterium]|nr:hypothetical protein [Candidatus Paceibacterota bacterium]